MTILIGIDPGKNTGISVYSTGRKELLRCETVGICTAMSIVSDILKKRPIEVYFEDARLRKWFGVKAGREKLQGAGSIKRDCAIWEEFCNINKIPFKAVAPKDTVTKMDAETFKKLTKWEGKTSEHSRDSGMLVFGR